MMAGHPGETILRVKNSRGIQQFREIYLQEPIRLLKVNSGEKYLLLLAGGGGKELF